MRLHPSAHELRQTQRNRVHYHRRAPAPSALSFSVFLRDLCDRDLEWNIDWAVAFIVDRLEQNWADAAETFRNIRIRAATFGREGLSHEIPYRIFNKLDAALFAGHLKNAVYLDISSLGSGVSGATYTHRLGPNPDVKRISIILNSDALEHAQAKDILGILIHHMIHAYFLVACGPQKEDEIGYGRLEHGVQFGKIILAIRKLSAVHGRELTSLNYGHSSAEIRHLAEEYYRPRHRDTVEREDRERWHCSHCHINTEGPSETEVEKYYSKICTPLFDQPKSVRKLSVQAYNTRHHELETRRRSLLAPSQKTVEFMFKDQPILVEVKKTAEYVGVMRAFDKASSRFLKLHKEVSKDTFLRFLEFLHTGSYRPEPRHGVGQGVERRGPPIIKPQSMTTQAPLLDDVRFVKMATLMDFDECKSYALDRMDAYGILYEDPVAVLKEIYSGYEPDSDLKTWARKFLVRAPSTSSPEYYNTVPTMEPPNLIKLESEQGAYRARFLDAIDASGALENDVNKARAELKVQGWYTWSSSSPLPSPSSYLQQRFLLPSHHALPLNLGLNQSPLRIGPSSSFTPSYHDIPTHHFSNPEFSLDRHLSSLNVRDQSPYERSDMERRRLLGLQYEKEKELQREKEKLKRLERQKEKVMEAQGQMRAAAMLDALHPRGWIEEY
ncbi:hypothetical protein BDW02DRAFT_490759 [Decorospora gaudefroyi]|uniref:Uncharacterized protein n=1 Tax=Decorospora gaudefroyi TaxID=184978 RepID=A0A6A5KR37_9PLEO|nr:hypothetical protein BDW02DRAFT_490759 [Decorospora gaudefroyi]